MDSSSFSLIISVYVIPMLFAITLHEVAHGRTARYFGDRTAELLGRLSLNPLRHIDPIGTLLLPGALLALQLPPFGWAKPVPVSISALRNPRRAAIIIALAGPAANILMALLWCAALVVLSRIRPGSILNNSRSMLVLDNWLMLMAQAGIEVNVLLAMFNLLPIPPLDGGRALAGLLPPPIGASLEKIAPVGIFIVVGLSVFRLLGWLFDPALRATGHLIHELLKRHVA